MEVETAALVYQFLSLVSSSLPSSLTFTPALSRSPTPGLSSSLCPIPLLFPLNKLKFPNKPQVRAAEDILSLTRTLKECWLFGKLDTIGTSEAERRADECAEEVRKGLGRLAGMKGGGGV